MAGKSSRGYWRRNDAVLSSWAGGFTWLLARPAGAASASRETIVPIAIGITLMAVIVSLLASLALEVLVDLSAIAQETEEPTWLYHIEISRFLCCGGWRDDDGHLPAGVKCGIPHPRRHQAVRCASSLWNCRCFQDWTFACSLHNNQYNAALPR